MPYPRRIVSPLFFHLLFDLLLLRLSLEFYRSSTNPSFRSFLNYLGSLEEIRNKDWLAEYEKQKCSLTPKKWTNEYSNLTLFDLETRGTLGVGGFGRVELVTLKSDPDKSFALKKLKKKVMVDQQQQEHVLNEKHIMQACDSPFICKYVPIPWCSVVPSPISLFESIDIPSYIRFLPFAVDFIKRTRTPSTYTSSWKSVWVATYGRPYKRDDCSTTPRHNSW